MFGLVSRHASWQGTLLGGREIAVKRLFAGGKGRNEEVCNEMDIISKAQHKNLVRFLGCCFTDKDSFLVYEFLVNRSLEHILFGKPSLFSKQTNKQKRKVLFCDYFPSFNILRLQNCFQCQSHADNKTVMLNCTNLTLDYIYPGNDFDACKVQKPK